MSPVRSSLCGFAVLAVILSGCVLGRVYRDLPLDEAKIAEIQPGVTTKQDILRRFGPPQEIEARELVLIGSPIEITGDPLSTKLPTEDVIGARYFRYTYSRGNAFLATVILFSYVEFDQKNDSLVIFFDDKDVVEDYAFVRGTEQLPRFGPLSR